MEPTTVGVKMASSVVTPLVRRLFVTEGPGAAPVDGPNSGRTWRGWRWRAPVHANACACSPT
ncbi:hypothetical protein ABZT03_30500 [Streptomyces sp. NPDC005574]|uniref:hypothetical protein n=1 Tax=Streptomyces sp. NPDC005574 TaxID=3156891 RepID=UPI0033B8CF96